MLTNDEGMAMAPLAHVLIVLNQLRADAGGCDAVTA